MGTKSKYFRVAVEGATVDGRTVDRVWIEEMAASYNPATYGARVNLEHMRGYTPDSTFRAYGDVLALKTEEIDIDSKKKLALLAQIDATPDLIAMTKARQKIYTSIEVQPKFADTGKAYLVGLAVTDSPASLGTEMLQFAAGLGDKSPLAGRKQQPGNHFSVAVETIIDLTEDKPEPPSLLDKVKDLLGIEKHNTAATHKKTEEQMADLRTATELLASTTAEAVKATTAAQKELTELTTKFTALQDKATTDAAKVAELSTKLDNTPASYNQRPPATGGNGATVTDC